MKPKIYFILGSFLSLLALTGLSISALYLSNLSFFILRRQGHMIGPGRWNNIISAFPLWIPVVAAVSAVLAIIVLKKYDFSYKKNFYLIIIAFLSAIILGGIAFDLLGLNDIFLRRGPMRRFYRQFDTDPNFDQFPRRQNLHQPGRGRFFEQN